MSNLQKVIERKFGVSSEEAALMIREVRKRCLEGDEDPEEILHDEFCLEPDYVIDLLG